MIYKSVYDNQQDILTAIEALHLPEGYQCDITYGNGVFWKGRSVPPYCYDICPLSDHVIATDSCSLPIESGVMQNIVFDPPFLTYIKSGREGNGDMVMAKRFGGYWRYEELINHYSGTITEVHRVLQRKGKLIFKCQDIIHNHKMHCTHSNIIGMAELVGFRLMDLFILSAKNRMSVKASASGIQTQRHARIYHSYFLVFEKR